MTTTSFIVQLLLGFFGGLFIGYCGTELLTKIGIRNFWIKLSIVSFVAFVYGFAIAFVIPSNLHLDLILGKFS
jgi:NhaP-type Na+/H+ or K+/H+ antiporter